MNEDQGRLKMIFSVLGLCACLSAPPSLRAQNEPSAPALQAPISVYNNWSSYDELSDNIPLTETLAMRELDELIRLKKAGVRFDYYMMDAFWFAPDGAYRTWRKPNWPNGPDAWINKCQENGVKPGLWFSTNTLGQDRGRACMEGLAQQERSRDVASLRAASCPTS